MAKRVQPSDGNYFVEAKSDIQFIPTGCRLLDCAVGGGWPLGRVSNIVGDNSTGKTLIAIEGIANFAALFPKGHICYREAESAFDENYAAALGIPMKRVSKLKDKLQTIEDFYEDLEEQIKWANSKGIPGLYILDSLDALSDREEQKRKIDQATFGGNKAKKLGELFRRLNQKVEASQTHLMIVSQVRDKIGIAFGDKTSRSGGKALNFYASQIVYLSHVATLTKEIKKVKRATGIRIRAKLKKNKIGLPHRVCDLVIRFGFGTDDLQSSIEFLEEAGRLKEAGLTLEQADKLLDGAFDLSADEYRATAVEIGNVVERVWRSIETDFVPKIRKYG